MKKRIFALALVCFMLVSMLPANGLHVHAEETQPCPLATDKTVDGVKLKAHTKELYEHLRATGAIEWTIDPETDKAVIADSVCGEPGAESYACKSEDCSAMVLWRTFVVEGEHVIDETKLVARVNPTCKKNAYGTDGFEAHYRCQVCAGYFVKNEDGAGYTKKDPNKYTNEGGLKIKPEHKWGEDFNCGDADKTCLNGCGQPWAADDHTWGLVPEIEMGAGEDGRIATATFTCEVCTDTKKVPVFKNCVHGPKQTADANGKLVFEADCTNPGVKAGFWYCTKCVKGETVYFADKYGMVEVDFEAIMIEPVGHTEGAMLQDENHKPVAATCDKDGSYWAICTKCDAKNVTNSTGASDCKVHKNVKHYKHTDGKIYVEIIVPKLEHTYGPTRLDATCGQVGYWVEACVNCGNLKNGTESQIEQVLAIVPALGHLTLEEVKNYNPFGTNTAEAVMTFYNPWTHNGMNLAGQGVENPYTVFQLSATAGLKITVVQGWADTDKNGVADAIDAAVASNDFSKLAQEKLVYTFTADTDPVQLVIYRGERITVKVERVDGEALDGTEKVALVAMGYDKSGNLAVVEDGKQPGRASGKDLATVARDTLLWDDGIASAVNPGIKEPTCLENGFYAWNCPCCDTMQTDMKNALDHDKVTVTVAPTCSDFGYSITYCARENCDHITDNDKFYADALYIKTTAAKTTGAEFEKLPVNTLFTATEYSALAAAEQKQCVQIVVGSETSDVKSNVALQDPVTKVVWKLRYNPVTGAVYTGANGENIYAQREAIAVAEKLPVLKATYTAPSTTNPQHNYVRVYVSAPTCLQGSTYFEVCGTCGILNPENGTGSSVTKLFTADNKLPHAVNMNFCNHEFDALCTVDGCGKFASDTTVHGNGEGQHIAQSAAECFICGKDSQQSIHTDTACDKIPAIDNKCDICGGADETLCVGHDFIDGYTCADGVFHSGNAFKWEGKVDGKDCVYYMIEIQMWVCGKTDGIYLGYCSGCRTFIKQTTAAGDHVKGTPERVETCTMGAANKYTCTCGEVFYEDINPNDNNNLDYHSKVYPSMNEAKKHHTFTEDAITNAFVFIPGTCTSKEQKGYECSDCGWTIYIYSDEEPNGHKFCDGFVDALTNGTDTQTPDTKCDKCGFVEGEHIDAISKKDPTCMMPGYTASGICVSCGLVKSTVIPATGHYVDGVYCKTLADILKLNSDYKGFGVSCHQNGRSDGGWTCDNEKCDGIFAIESVFAYAPTYTGENACDCKAATTNPAAEAEICENHDKIHACKYGCEAAATGNGGTLCGYHLFVYSYSPVMEGEDGEVYNPDTQTVDIIIIPTTGHSFDLYYNTFDAKHCAECGKYSDKHHAFVDANEDGNCDTCNIAKAEHCDSFVKRVYKDTADCYTNGYTLMKCSKCGLKEGFVIDYVAKFDHKKTDGTTAVKDATCTTGAYCELCKQNGTEQPAGLKSAMGHENADEVWFPYRCDEFFAHLKANNKTTDNGYVLEYKFDYHCTREGCCDTKMDDAADDTNKSLPYYVRIQDKVRVIHGDVTEWTAVQGDCQTYQTDVFSCRTCGYSYTTNATDFGDHKFVLTTPESMSVEKLQNGNGFDYATSTEYMCTVCEKTPEELFGADKAEWESKYVTKYGAYAAKAADENGVQFHLTVDNAHKAGAGFTDSTLIKIVVSMESYSKVDIYSFIASLKYNKDAVDFVPELTRVLNESFCFANVVDSGDYLTIIGAAHDVEGNPVNVNVAEETALIELYFRVNSKTATETTFAFIQNGEKFTAGENYTIQAINADNEIVACAGDWNKIEIQKFLNGHIENVEDMPEVIDLQDMLLAVELFKSNGYNVVLDVDQDGVMELSDVLALVKYISGELTYSELWLMDCDGGDACTNEENPCPEDVVVDEAEPEVPSCPCVQWWLNQNP